MWTDEAQDRDMDHEEDWKLTCLAQRVLSVASQPGQPGARHQWCAQWCLTSSSMAWLMAQSAVSAGSHITENWERFKYQRVVMTLRSTSKRWRNGLTAVPCSSKGSAKSCACGGIIPCKRTAWKPKSQKAALQKRTWSSNKLNTSQEGALAKATSTWAAPEQHCQHFGDPSSQHSCKFQQASWFLLFCWRVLKLLF